MYTYKIKLTCIWTILPERCLCCPFIVGGLCYTSTQRRDFSLVHDHLGELPSSLLLKPLVCILHPLKFVLRWRP